MKPLRFGIVGCGGIANFHAECLQRLETDGLANLTAGAELNPESRAKFGEKWGAQMVATLAELVQRDDVDVVTVCSPSGLHGEHVTQIARAKKHILCEKPLDLVLAKADAALAAVKENGVVLGGIFQQRFDSVGDVRKNHRRQALDAWPVTCRQAAVVRASPQVIGQRQLGLLGGVVHEATQRGTHFVTQC